MESVDERSRAYMVQELGEFVVKRHDHRIQTVSIGMAFLEGKDPFAPAKYYPEAGYGYLANPKLRPLLCWHDYIERAWTAIQAHDVMKVIARIQDSGVRWGSEDA